MTTPRLEPDPYEADVPEAVWSLWGHEVAAWHTPEWWRRHWELSGLLEGIESAWLPDGRENWIRCRQSLRKSSAAERRME